MGFVVAKVFWFLVHPGNLFIMALLVATALLWTRWRRLGRAALAVLALAGLVVAVVPFGQWLTVALENRFPPPRELPLRVDGIIVLGGAVNPVLTKARGQVAVGGSIERLLFFADLAGRYTSARLVFTGGSGSLFDQDLKEAEGARRMLDRFGLDTSRVLFEDQSRNTYENAVLSQKLARPRAGETWLLITSAQHMPRAVGVFRKLGWPVTPFPVDYRSDGSYRRRPMFNFIGGLGGLASGLKEWLGLASYYASGRSAAFFPGPQERAH